MAQNSKEYIHVCALSEMPKRFGKRVRLEDGGEAAIFDIDGTLYAVDNVCPHQKFPLLYEGEIKDCTVTCPMHSWEFDLQTGECLSGNKARLATYEVFVQDGQVMMEKPVPAKPKWME